MFDLLLRGTLRYTALPMLGLAFYAYVTNRESLLYTVFGVCIVLAVVGVANWVRGYKRMYGS